MPTSWNHSALSRGYPVASAQDESARAVLSEGVDPSRGSERMTVCAIWADTCHLTAGASPACPTPRTACSVGLECMARPLKSMHLPGRRAGLLPGREVLSRQSQGSEGIPTCLQAQGNIKEKLRESTQTSPTESPTLTTNPPDAWVFGDLSRKRSGFKIGVVQSRVPCSSESWCPNRSGGT